MLSGGGNQSDNSFESIVANQQLEQHLFTHASVIPVADIKHSSIDMDRSAHNSDNFLTSEKLSQWTKLADVSVKLECMEKLPFMDDDSSKCSSTIDMSDDWNRQQPAFSKGLMLSPSRSEHKDGEIDDDSSVSDDWKKLPRVGRKYQVHRIPARLKQTPDYDDRTDEMIWDPSAVDQGDVENYLLAVDLNHSASSNTVHIRDNEDALLLLRQSNNDVNEALRRFKFRPPSLTNEMSVWSKEECRQFEHGLTLYGKDFHTIHHNKVKTRSVGEIVKFYYFWKKSQRSANTRTRLGKKKEASQRTDYVEKLLDESAPSPSHSTHCMTQADALQRYCIESETKQVLSKEVPCSSNSTTTCPDLNSCIENEEHIDILETIDPNLHTFLHDYSYPPSPLSAIEPGIFVAYTELGQRAPIAMTIIHRESTDLSPATNYLGSSDLLTSPSSEKSGESTCHSNPCALLPQECLPPDDQGQVASSPSNYDSSLNQAADDVTSELASQCSPSNQTESSSNVLNHERDCQGNSINELCHDRKCWNVSAPPNDNCNCQSTLASGSDHRPATSSRHCSTLSRNTVMNTIAC